MNTNPIVVGHRGAMGHETENTIASIKKALDLGVGMIEIDVFLIKTGEVVVFHDETVDRLTNSSGKIEEYSYSDVEQLVLKGNHKIPLLQEVFETINHTVRLNIELKGANTVDAVDAIIGKYSKEKGWKLNDFLISSFKWEELKEMRRVNKNIPIAILTEANPIDAISIAKELDAEAINTSFKKLTLENVNTIKKAGFKIYTWTVNEPKDIENIKNMGVDGIITNYPDRIN
ncbi:MAG: glycerophosphodiester phosphodiesterase family protein [Cellulophaga sp.]